MTPLHYASQNGHELLVEALLAAGADLFIANQFGATPSDLASDWQRLDILAMIAGQYKRLRSSLERDN
jgi:ankyrin repeat protein